MSSKITSSTAGSTTNIDLIKAELCREICGENVTEISVDSLSVNIYGKNKNSLKIKCNNVNTRDFLLKQARSRKPEGIYVTEFLTPNSLKVYHQLCGLRRNYPQNFKAVYTRNGEIFCRINPED